MCAVSNIGTYWANTFPQRYPDWQQPFGTPGGATGGGSYIVSQVVNPVTQQQFEALRKEVAELKELLLAAKKFDEATGQPDCSMEEKVELIKTIAIMVGIDMKDVFPD